MNKSKKESKTKRIDIFSEMTHRMIELIEKDGIAPWHKSWQGTNRMPTNLFTLKPYRGVNIFTLGFSPYESHYWVTFNQAKELAASHAKKTGRKIKKITQTKEGGAGAKHSKPWYFDEESGAPFVGGIKKGEKKYGYVVFWKRQKIKSKDSNQDENEDDEKSRFIPMLRFTPIFNAEQADGIEIPVSKTPHDFSPVKACEDLLEQYKTGPKVIHGGDRAFYSPDQDLIKVPEQVTFDHPQAYYNVLFHEHVHGTGHEKRLARKTLMDKTYFGSHTYSQEELVAEMGASFLSAHCGISTPPMIENSAAYLKHWLSAMKQDPKLLVHSASRAQKAFDFITGVKFEKDSEEV